MTCPKTEKAVSFISMKLLNLDFMCGSVIAAIMAPAVFAGGANACHHNAETVGKTSTELPHEADDKTEIEV